jgi:hypothetical protein
MSDSLKQSMKQRLRTVFNHRETELNLPLKDDFEFIEMLQPLWREYQKDLPRNQVANNPPELIQDVISLINTWLKNNTQLCISELSDRI